MLYGSIILRGLALSSSSSQENYPDQEIYAEPFHTESLSLSGFMSGSFQLFLLLNLGLGTDALNIADSTSLTFHFFLLENSSPSP